VSRRKRPPNRKPIVTRLVAVERQAADRERSRIPGNVSVRREAPGLYSVHVNLDTLLLGTLRPLAGHVRRDRTSGLWAVDGGPPEHPNRDAAVSALLAERSH
jgi:hypothetical protein